MATVQAQEKESERCLLPLWIETFHHRLSLEADVGKLGHSANPIDFEGTTDSLGRRSSTERCQNINISECFDRRFEPVHKGTS